MISGHQPHWVRLTAVVCAGLLAPGDVGLLAQEQSAPPQSATATTKLKTPDQLDSLVAPIALYPDPLLAQVLAASTYPLEVVQAQRWLKANPKLTGEELTKAAAKEPWDASVQALVAFPDVVKLLDANIQWTQDLGNAFLDQQGDVMEAVQRMRKKAKDAGKLESSKEQKVEVKTIETKTVIEIQPSNPQVIYVPSYNPVVVYGPPVYAYPPVVYPTSAYVATAAVSFGVGVMMGAFWSGCCGGGGWGWGCGWGGNNITINNNFGNRYGYSNISGGNRTNISGGNRTNVGGDRTNVGSGNRWQHNPEHRRSVPYGNRDTAQRFSGSSRDSAGRTQRFDGRSGQADRSGLSRDAGASRDRGSSGSRTAGTNQDRIGDRSIQSSDRGRQNSAFSGSESRSRTQAASDRGFSSSRASGGYGGSGARSGGSRPSGGGGRSSGGGGRRR
jgi:hypothetical protein